MRKLALVTGANKGIGLETVRSLLTQSTPVQVLLGCRNEANGANAIAELKNSSTFTPGSIVELLLIDVEDEKTISAAVETVKDLIHGHNATTDGFEPSIGLDILINNAGIGVEGIDEFAELIHPMKVNYVGTRLMCQHFGPLLADGARVINVSSRNGRLKGFSLDVRAAFSAPDLTLHDLDALAGAFEQYALREFEKETGNGDNPFKSATQVKVPPQSNSPRPLCDLDWPPSSYAVSKLAISTLARILQRDEIQPPRVMYYACNPGRCRTDMTRYDFDFDKRKRPASEGARVIVWLSMEPSTPLAGFYGEDLKLYPEW